MALVCNNISLYFELMNVTLFLDLDGVLADFDKKVLEITGKKPEQLEQRFMWPRIAKHPNFYGSLDWMPDGEDLWNQTKHLNPIILTGLPRGNWAEPQKRSWCAQYLGPDIQVITCQSKEKHLHAQSCLRPNTKALLIDDREKLQQAWEEAGGIFIHHIHTKKTIAQLTALNLL
jgi:hypothetical protein